MTEKTVQVHAGAGVSYDIVIGHGLLARAGAMIGAVARSRRVVVVADENTARHYLSDLIRSLEKSGFMPAPPVIFPAGEATKNFERLEYITERALSCGVDRHSALVALGGGVVGDVAGFAASVIMRGLPLIQVPTTLLAQVDSSVGGKTGINTQQGKNLVGSFYQPRLVIIDGDTLKTLPERELRAGYAEIVKYALINDPDFFEWLEQNGAALLAGDTAARGYAIEKSCRAKAAIVAADEREEKDLRALLNLGHTFGHALEAAGGYDGRLLHGEAVAAGMALAFSFAAETGVCSHADADRVHKHLSRHGLPLRPPFSVTAQDMLDKMRGDKKNRDGNITLVMTRGIGRAFVDRNVDEMVLESFLKRSFG
jgi:3-dehydroquinate synthase